MNYNQVIDRIRSVMESSRTKNQLEVGNRYCKMLVDKYYPLRMHKDTGEFYILNKERGDLKVMIERKYHERNRNENRIK